MNEGIITPPEDAIPSLFHPVFVLTEGALNHMYYSIRTVGLLAFSSEVISARLTSCQRTHCF